MTSRLLSTFAPAPRTGPGLRLVVWADAPASTLHPAAGEVLLGRCGPNLPVMRLLADMVEWIAYTPLHNLAGIPAISLPSLHSSEGLPIGSMFSADRGQQDRLLALVLELETACPCSDRWPPLNAAAAGPAHHLSPASSS